MTIRLLCGILTGKSRRKDNHQRSTRDIPSHHYSRAKYVSSPTTDSLGTPPSPVEIHARWGEPADNPDEYSVCTDFEPNPFKLGFCRNCQRQHKVTTGGHVESIKVSNKIARPAVSKTATNASQQDVDRESDVDLAALLRERHRALANLARASKSKSRRHRKKGSKKSSRNRPKAHEAVIENQWL